MHFDGMKIHSASLLTLYDRDIGCLELVAALNFGFRGCENTFWQEEPCTEPLNDLVNVHGEDHTHAEE